MSVPYFQKHSSKTTRVTPSVLTASPIKCSITPKRLRSFCFGLLSSFCCRHHQSKRIASHAKETTPHYVMFRHHNAVAQISAVLSLLQYEDFLLAMMMMIVVVVAVLWISDNLSVVTF
jgi:hypothetical protein